MSVKRNLDLEREISIVFQLSKTISAVFALLMENTYTETSDIANVIEDVGTAIEPKIVVWKIRGALKDHAARVQFKLGVGYWLTREDKETISGLLEKHRSAVE